MTIVCWDPVMRCGVGFMDEDHRQLMAAVAEIDAMVAHGELGSPAQQAFRALAERTHHHFAEEEGLMRRARYDSLGLHKLEHDDFADHLQRFGAQFGKGGIALHEDMMRFVGLWFLGHILGSDRRLGTTCAPAAVRAA